MTTALCGNKSARNRGKKCNWPLGPTSFEVHNFFSIMVFFKKNTFFGELSLSLDQSRIGVFFRSFARPPLNLVLIFIEFCTVTAHGPQRVYIFFRFKDEQFWLKNKPEVLSFFWSNTPKVASLWWSKLQSYFECKKIKIISEKLTSFRIFRAHFRDFRSIIEKVSFFSLVFF